MKVGLYARAARSLAESAWEGGVLEIPSHAQVERTVLCCSQAKSAVRFRDAAKLLLV